MSHMWKYNDVELELNMADADFVETYEKAFEKMGESEKRLQKIGKYSEQIKAYCNMYYDLFDDLFGEGTGQRLFGGKHISNEVEECYDSFLTEVRSQIAQINKNRANRFNKFKPKGR